MNTLKKYPIIVFLFSLCFIAIPANCETENEKVIRELSIDTIELQQALELVIKNHPSVKEAEEAINIANAKIGLSKSAYLPDIDASATYYRVGPTPTLPFNGMEFQMFPADNYSASLNYRQNIYDFGKTKKNILLEKENKGIYEKNVVLVKQNLAAVTIATYYNLYFLQEALHINNEELKVLQEHIAFIEKKISTGSATQYELISTKVRLSNVETQKMDLETMQKVQSSVLNSLLGNADISISMVKCDKLLDFTELKNDSLVEYAISHRVEMAIAKENESVKNLQYQLTKSQNNPTINLFASGGGKNGYLLNLNEVRMNFTAGAGLRIPIYDANRVKNNLMISKSGITNSELETELLKRRITNEVVECQSKSLSAKQKITLNELMLKQAKEAFSLARVNYNVGSITNLDMLEAETSVSEAQLRLLKSQIDYIVSQYKLMIAIGNQVN